MRRRRFFLILLLVTGLLIAGTWLNNNSSLRPLSRATFLRELDRAITASRYWILDVGEGTSVFRNEQTVALLENAPLLHMVADCARASGDQRLQAVAARYFRVTAGPHYLGRLV